MESEADAVYGFPFCIELPKPGETVRIPLGQSISGKKRKSRALPDDGAGVGPDDHKETTCEVTVLEPKGKNGVPLRSRLFELGFLFSSVVSSLSTGHNFICQVPVKDEETGEERPCNALLKIPKGSLGNPFRHLKRRHRQVYNAVMEHPKRSAKDRKLSSAAEKTTGAADRAGDEKKRFLLSPEFKKGITFCAMNLLPFDAIQLKSFQYFGAKKRHTKLYSSLEMPELEDLGSTVKQVKEEFLKRGIDRISETSNFYKGIPFLRVTVQPDFVPRPLVTISFVKDKGVLERLNLLADPESCTEIRSADPKILTGENAEYSNEFLVPVVQKIFAAYGLGGIWESVVSMGCTSDLGYFTNYVHAEYQKNSSERMGCVEKYLNPSAHVPSSRELTDAREILSKTCSAFEKEGQDALGIEKEFPAYEQARNEWKGGLGEVGSFWESWGLSANPEESLPILFKYASSLQVAYPSSLEMRDLQLQRDIRMIENKDFLAEKYKLEIDSEETQQCANAILFIRYNADLAQ